MGTSASRSSRSDDIDNKVNYAKKTGSLNLTSQKLKERSSVWGRLGAEDVMLVVRILDISEKYASATATALLFLPPCSCPVSSCSALHCTPLH